MIILYIIEVKVLLLMKWVHRGAMLPIMLTIELRMVAYHILST